VSVFARATPRPVQLGFPGWQAVIVESRRARRRAPVSEVAPRDSLGRPQMPSEWRRLRAQVGGLERAMREVMAQRDEARATLRKYEEAKASRAWQRAADPELVKIKADLLHAADCARPTCPRCERIVLDLESERPRYADEREVIEALVEADVLRLGVVQLLEASRASPSPGKAQRVAVALHGLRAVMSGDVAAARRLLRQA